MLKELSIFILDKFQLVIAFYGQREFAVYNYA